MSDRLVDKLTDDDLDALLDRLAERADQRDDLQLPGGGASRRAVLAGLLSAGGLAGGGASLAGAIGESESYGSATGVAGTDSEPLSESNVQDLHAQDLQVDNLAEVEQLSPEVATGGYHFAGAYPGQSPTDRLKNARESATPGDVIFLEHTGYGTDFTAGQHNYIGGFGGAGEGSTANISTGTTWTLTENHAQLVGVNIAGSVNFDSFGGRVLNCNGAGNSGTVNIKTNNVLVSNCNGLDVIFESGTNSGLVDSGVAVNVTDNGSNTVGDIS